jgi:hypothetical protein
MLPEQRERDAECRILIVTQGATEDWCERPSRSAVAVAKVALESAIARVAMVKRSPQPEVAPGVDLSVPERVLLFCVASGTEWERAGVTGATVTATIVRGLVERDAGNQTHADRARARYVDGADERVIARSR